ncbi:MAG: trypsin-like peptidase domain-containing protein [Acidimicrobiales bacterium]|nr:trypsin-like peptidase domain-containing protein [Acidimicrobiales bacterium]
MSSIEHDIMCGQTAPGVPGGGTSGPGARRHRARRAGRRTMMALAGAAVIGTGAGVSTAFAGGTAFASTADASSIANQVDPALVDITSTLGFQGGQAAGTGMIISSNGDVLTNNHVVEGATSLTARLADSQKTYKATVVGVDPTDDVAVIHLQGASGLPTVPTGNSSSVKVGDSVVAIGNAQDLPGKPSVSSGNVVALDQDITAADESGAGAENLHGLIQMNAPIEPGDSGGPLLNASGQVIGMDTAAESQSGSIGTIADQSSNVGFAIPINSAMSIAHQIEKGKSSSTVHIGATPMLGVEVTDASSAAANGNGDFGGLGPGLGSGGLGSGGLGIEGPGGSIFSPYYPGQGSTSSGSLGSGSSSSTTSGALVQGVEQNSPAARAGISSGDTITGFGGTTVTSTSSLSKAIDAHHPGDHVKVTWVDQNGNEHHATVTLVQGPTA